MPFSRWAGCQEAKRNTDKKAEREGKLLVAHNYCNPAGVISSCCHKCSGRRNAALYLRNTQIRLFRKTAGFIMCSQIYENNRLSYIQMVCSFFHHRCKGNFCARKISFFYLSLDGESIKHVCLEQGC
jgi:hypothetical protein